MTNTDKLPEEQKVFTCSFCGKTNNEVQVIIVGPVPSITICNECVRVCLCVLLDKIEGKTIPGATEHDK